MVNPLPSAAGGWVHEKTLRNVNLLAVLPGIEEPRQDKLHSACCCCCCAAFHLRAEWAWRQLAPHKLAGTWLAFSTLRATDVLPDSTKH